MRCRFILQQTRQRNLYISILQLRSGNQLALFDNVMITSLQIICPLSYKARPGNLIGPMISELIIITPQWIESELPDQTMLWAEFGLASRHIYRTFF